MMTSHINRPPAQKGQQIGILGSNFVGYTEHGTADIFLWMLKNPKLGLKDNTES